MQNMSRYPWLWMNSDEDIAFNTCENGQDPWKSPRRSCQRKVRDGGTWFSARIRKSHNIMLPQMHFQIIELAIYPHYTKKLVQWGMCNIRICFPWEVTLGIITPPNEEEIIFDQSFKQRYISCSLNKKVVNEHWKCFLRVDLIWSWPHVRFGIYDIPW
jgi:hypothetical protein